jgi:predicted ATPase
MIRQDERNRYHFDIGMALLESQSNEKPADLLMILKQVNFGVPSLLPDGSKRLSIAELNYGAASEMVNSSNFTSAYHLAKTAVMLLPDECWTRQYALSLKFYFLLSKAAHSYRKIDEAKVRREVLHHKSTMLIALTHHSFLDLCANYRMHSMK